MTKTKPAPVVQVVSYDTKTKVFGMQFNGALVHLFWEYEHRDDAHKRRIVPITLDDDLLTPGTQRDVARYRTTAIRECQTYCVKHEHQFTVAPTM